MITLSQLRKVYRQPGGDVVALDGVDLHVPRGEIAGVIGQSGAGKSTLIRCVNLLEQPTSGTVVVDGQELTALPPTALRAARLRIGMIFQQFNLLSSRTVADNVAYPLEIAGVDRQRRRQRVAELLDLVGLGDKARTYPAQLSGGQKQRVGIARALAAEPTVLLCDEATSALDPDTTASILALLRDLNSQLDLTILLITHEMDVVKAICDSVALLEAGRIVESGPVAEVARRRDSALARGLLPLSPEVRLDDAATVVDITFAGEQVGTPLLATLVREFGLDVNVVGGGIETVGGVRLGRLQIELPGARDEHRAVLAYLDEQGFTPTVLSPGASAAPEGVG